MTRSRIVLLLIFSTLFIYTSVVFSGCVGSKCDLTCQNGGVCLNKQCSCATGYDGTNCEILSRARLLKADTGTSTYVTASGGDLCHTQPFTMNISAGSESYLVSISNFAGSGLTTNHVIVSGLTFYIADSIASSSTIISAIQGSVSSDGSALSYSYTSYNKITNASNSCSGTAAKQ